MKHKYIIRKYYSGFCTHEVEAKNEDQACEMVKDLPTNNDIMGTLEDREECNNIELDEDNNSGELT